ncbi:hypothetical protein JAAARDRAFT_29992 [Jaapia argillacea MUCL 33604]|uniref:Uncharacterized protein n=1 Tax=Jaapia argillacea MUCL 33604 TaxID=933084 RepID=A0A067QHK9_9AGAM|nr:hypothetical protein JAAARDRAFT_29992 [Jaapia argillacea MUCL 33604]
MTTTSFVLPFTFLSTPDTSGTPSSSKELLELAYSQAEPSALCSWGLASRTATEQAPGYPAYGAAMGCQDGTVYLFHPTRKPTGPPRNDHRRETSRHLSPTSSLRHERIGLGVSRPTSPASVTSTLSTLSPFNMTSRSRIVSGVSKEQAEAPKNYVDFEDEPGKLKDMLKGKGPKEKATAGEGIIAGGSLEKSHSSDTASIRSALPGSSTSKRRDDGASIMSHGRSPSTASWAESRPTSPPPLITTQTPPTPLDNRELSLFCHIFPPRFGFGRAVAELRILEDKRHLLCLQESGDLSVFDINGGCCISNIRLNENCIAPPTGIKEQDMRHKLWRWKRLDVVPLEESSLVLACGSASVTSSPSAMDTGESDVPEMTRLCIVEMRNAERHLPDQSGLKKFGEWCIDGPGDGSGFYRDLDGVISLFWVNNSHHLITHVLSLAPIVPAPPPPHHGHDSDANSLASIPLPNPFKALKGKSVEDLSATDGDSKLTGRVELSEEVDVGVVAPETVLSGIRIWASDSGLRGAVWSDALLIGFEVVDQVLRSSFQSPIAGLKDVTWFSHDSYGLHFEDRVDIFLVERVDANGDLLDDASGAGEPQNVQPVFLHSIACPWEECSTVLSATEILSVISVENSQRQLRLLSQISARVMWTPTTITNLVASGQATVTSMLPLDLDLIILGYSDGFIRRSSISQLVQGDIASSPNEASDFPISGRVHTLHAIENERTSDRVIVGGGDDGSVAFWTLRPLKLASRWTLFTTPLAKVIQIREEKAPSLRGCVLCVSQDGTVAVIAVDGCQFLYLIPGSIAPLSRVCAGGDNLLLFYDDGRCRLWDAKTHEFWRSMNYDKAQEMLGQGGWVERAVEDVSPPPNMIVRPLSSTYSGPDTACTLLVDVEQVVARAMHPRHLPMDKVEKTVLPLKSLRAILGTALTPGLSPHIDGICKEKLGSSAATGSVGTASNGSMSIFSRETSQDVWTVSGEVSAPRALSIAALLGSVSLFDDLAEVANTAVVFYATSLGSVVGPSYKLPSLPYLATRWFESSNDLRHAIQSLFDAGLAHLSDGEVTALAEQWQHSLPCIQPDSEKQGIRSAIALLLCGRIATFKYTLLSTSALTDISKSIAMYLHDDHSLYRVLAIDLCSRGFDVWQQFVDAMEMLRALFLLATNSRKESISTQNVAPQARTAVLQIASSNSPLFMTTLSLDILHPRSVEHRKCIMQLIAFIIRRQPLVLYPNLPRLLEAVVKSLDPNLTASRDAVLDAATEILGHVVKTFPTVDFHAGTQRLAVGTSEGAVIMYDLKTATRLYVLEGHKKRLVACSFSPDGRRLVTVSLEEGAVLVWKVGSSFSSFFNPGAPPRQGHSGSEPFKTLGFNVGDEAKMNITATLEHVRFEWVADRSVKLKIRDSILTFST